MKVNNPSLQKIFEGMGKKLQADFEFLTSQLSHALSTGEAREFILKELLRKYLPAKLGIDKGIILSSDGQVSKQIDIVIYDKLNTPLLYGAENLRLFPVEGVYAIISIKSKLDSSGLRESVENIHSVKKLPKKAFVEQRGNIINEVNLYGKELPYFPIIGLAFAYSATNPKNLKDELEQLDDIENPESNLDTICILNEFLITNQKADGRIFITKEPDSRRVFIRGNNSLLLFYLLMMHVLPQTWMAPIKMTEYAQNITFGEVEV